MSRQEADAGGILPQAPGAGHAPRDAEHQRLLDELAAHPERLESGLRSIDRDLQLGDALRLDLLLADPRGRPVAVLVGDRDLAGALGRLAAVLAALLQGRWILERLYGERGLAAHQRPRFVLLSPRFGDPVAPLLELLGSVDLRVLEWSRAAGADGAPVLVFSNLGGLARAPAAALGAASGAAQVLARDGGSAGVSAAGAAASNGPGSAPPTANDRGEVSRLLAELDLPAECTSLCLKLRDSICSLATGVHVDRNGSALDVRVADAVLARVTPCRTGLAVTVGSNGAPAFDVRDEVGLNACLNAIFREFYAHHATLD